jgi:hypothetical protein
VACSLYVICNFKLLSIVISTKIWTDIDIIFVLFSIGFCILNMFFVPRF